MFNYNDCGVCFDIKYLSKTNCNHHLCIECITRIKKCPFCRTDFILPKLFEELKKYFIKLENKKLSKITTLFNILPNYIEPNNDYNIQSTNLFIDYIYLDSQERRTFQQNTHEYLIDQLDFTTYQNYIPLEQTNLNLI